MTEFLKYPVRRLLPRRARKQHKLRAMCPEVARMARESDAVTRHMLPIINGEIQSHPSKTLDQKPETIHSAAEVQARALGQSQNSYRITLQHRRAMAAPSKGFFEAAAIETSIAKHLSTLRVVTIINQRMNEGWRTAGFNNEFTRLALSTASVSTISRNRINRIIKISVDWVTGAKKYRQGDYVYSRDENTDVVEIIRPELWDMYRALKIPQGFDKPFCALAGPKQHRALIGVINVWPISLPEGGIVVQCEFFNRRNKRAREEGVRQGYMVFHPEVPFYGFGWTSKKAIADMKKSMAKRLTEIVRQSSS